MTSDRYIMLTGSKNNAGDFLIKHRAFSLLSHLRPDRELVDWDAWRPFKAEDLSQINSARAIILTGGPSLKQDMYPSVYALSANLDDIQVPLITMGIGWNSPLGDWSHTQNFEFTSQTKNLLNRINSSGYLSSVRDYHTLNALKSHRLDNWLMTGCPVYYSLEHLDLPAQITERPSKVAFSMGVAMAASSDMEAQTKSIILALKERFNRSRFAVAFHHSIDERYVDAYGTRNQLYRAQRKMVDWLEQHNIEYRDISGNAESMIHFYSECDLHVGFRVHAHIFMSSISRPSLLLAEDGRGKAVSLVIGSTVLDAYTKRKLSFFSRACRKIGLTRFGTYVAAKNLEDDVIRFCDYELTKGVRFSSVRKNIQQHYPIMRRFIEQLP